MSFREVCFGVFSSADVFSLRSWNDHAFPRQAHCECVWWAGFQVVGRHGDGPNVSAGQGMPIGGVGQHMVDRTAIVEVSAENGYVVIGIPTGVAARAGSEQHDPRYL